MISHEFASSEALAEALAASVAAALQRRLDAEGAASLAVSGGTTPVKFFQALAGRKLDWRHVTITLVDDRWVPASSRRSNAATIRQHLLRGEAAAAHFIPLVTGHDTPEEGRATVDAALRAIPLPLAAVVLGIGTDGHTASLFPGGDRLGEALNPAAGYYVESMRAEAAEEPRITLTLPVLLAADLVAIHIEGETKHRVLHAALQPGTASDMPIRAVLARVPAPDVYWCA